jgi:maltose alpha-D-glucosyltransferase/alpha-amylase
MLDSFYHAAHVVLFGEAPGVIPRPESLPVLEAWAKFWYRAVGKEFLSSYLATPGVAGLLPRDRGLMDSMLRIYLLNLALKKLSFELATAPERIRIPAHAIVELAEAV